MAKQHLYFIDFVRAITIVLVVLGHWRPEGCPAWYQDVYDVLHTFRMPVFLAISGYLYMVTRRPMSYPQFLRHKFRRLMVPYFVGSTAIIAFKLAVGGGPGVEQPVTPAAFVEMFYFPAASNVFWFLWALWWMFVMVYWLDTPLKRIIAIAVCVALGASKVGLPQVCSFDLVPHYFIFFLSGTLLHDIPQFLPTLRRITLWSLVVAMALLTVLFLNGAEWLQWPMAYVGMAMMMRLGLLLEARETFRGRTFLLQLAAASYILYLGHTTSMGVVKSVLLRYLDITLVSHFLLATAIIFPAGVLLPYLLWRYVLTRFQITRTLFGLKPFK